MQDTEKRLYAPFFPRLAAFLLDRLVLGALLLIPRITILIGLLRGGLSAPVLFTYTPAAIVLYLLRAAYFVTFTYTSGATPGKRAMGLRVVPAEGERCRFADVLYRETVGRYLSGILCIGYLLCLGDGECRALHDRICGTRVVWSERKAPVKAGGVPAPLRTVAVSDPEKEWYKPYRV